MSNHLQPLIPKTSVAKVSVNNAGTILVDDKFLSEVRELYPHTSLRIPLGYRVATDPTGKGIVFFTQDTGASPFKGASYQVNFDPMAEEAWTQRILARVPHETVRPKISVDIAAKWEDLNKEFAKSAGGGLYGYPKKIQAACESASRKLGKRAKCLISAAVKKDPQVIAFLETHAARSKSIPAKLLVASYVGSMPKVSHDKTAAKGMYGFRRQTAKRGMRACSDLRQEAGIIACDLHGRKAALYDRLTGFMKEHGRRKKDHGCRLILSVYPEASMKTASPKSLSTRQLNMLKRKLNLPGEVSGRGTDWELEVPNEKVKALWEKHIPGLGGYRTGYGGWVLSQGYRSMGDWNNPGSRHHFASDVPKTYQEWLEYEHVKVAHQIRWDRGKIYRGVPLFEGKDLERNRWRIVSKGPGFTELYLNDKLVKDGLHDAPEAKEEALRMLKKITR